MSDLALVPIADVNFGAFTRAFNHAYSDYFTPIVMSEAAFHALIERDDIDLDRSVAALDGTAIVGTGLLGVRERQGWIGGMGVIPQYRRRGIGRQMLRHLLGQSHALTLHDVLLEVIEANAAAQTLYYEMGFRPRRHLLILERAPQGPPVPDAGYSPGPADPHSLIEHHANFHDTPNCWQRDRRSLHGLVRRAHGVAVRDERLRAYALGWFDEQEIRLLDLATDPSDPLRRQAAAHALLAYLHREYPHAPGRAYNIAENDPALPAFFEAGYSASFRQIEMGLDLSGT